MLKNVPLLSTVVVANWLASKAIETASPEPKPLALILTAVVGGPIVVERERDNPAALACSRAEINRASKVNKISEGENSLSKIQ